MDKTCKKIHELCDELYSDGRVVRIMEVCGTHTMAIARSGMRSLLPENLKLISGPGCPVCVTDQSYIDQAIMLSRNDRYKVIIATYGDMIRVPGREGSLTGARISHFIIPKEETFFIREKRDYEIAKILKRKNQR